MEEESRQEKKGEIEKRRGKKIRGRKIGEALKDGKQIRFKMLLELPMSEAFAGGRRREGRESIEGKREVEWWENKVKSSPQTLSKWEKGVQSWRGG